MQSSNGADGLIIDDDNFWSRVSHWRDARRSGGP
jgi:hypothetical protein